MVSINGLTSTNITSFSKPSIYPIIVDDFEDGNLSEYSVDGTDVYEVTTDSLEGTYSLKVWTSSGGLSSLLYSTTGLNAYPEVGDTFQITYANNFSDSVGSMPELVFGFQDLDNYYVIQIGLYRVTEFAKVVNGTTTVLGSTTTTPDNIIFTVEWTASGITVTRLNTDTNEINTINTDDTTFSNGGVGFRVITSSKEDGVESIVDGFKIIQ